MKIIEIDEKEFDKLVKAEPNATIFQTSNWANYMSGKAYHPLYIKCINNNGTDIALSMFLLKKDSLITSRFTATAPFGYLVNFYDDDELVSFNDELIKFLKTKKVNKLVISPMLQETGNDLIINNLNKMGYRKTNDNFLYSIDVRKETDSKFDKNLIFRFKQIDKGTVDFDHVLLSNVDQKIYDKLEDCSSIYINQLDSSRSLKNLDEHQKECEKFIQRHKNDSKYENKINQKLEDIRTDKKKMSQIKKIQKVLGENPILCLACINKYNDKYTILFLENKDEDSIFDSQEYLINKLVLEANDRGFNWLHSFNEFINADKVPLVGEYTINI